MVSSGANKNQVIKNEFSKESQTDLVLVSKIESPGGPGADQSIIKPMLSPEEKKLLDILADSFIKSME